MLSSNIYEVNAQQMVNKEVVVGAFYGFLVWFANIAIINFR